jgi:hypothetical protein
MAHFSVVTGFLAGAFIMMLLLEHPVVFAEKEWLRLSPRS